MNFTQSFRLALKSLWTSKIRSLLTMLGIIIGVGAVIIITSLGNGIQTYMNNQFEQMGSNRIIVQTFGRGGSRSVNADDMYALVEKYPQFLSGVTPYTSISASVRHGSTEFSRTSIYGVGETFYNPQKDLTMGGGSLEKGRFLSYLDVERNQNVCVIGSYLEETAFGGDALGKTLTVGGYPFTVVGVLSQMADLSEGSGDDALYLPYTLAKRLGASGYAATYQFTSTGRDTAAAAKGIVENALYKIFQSSDYYFVMTSAEMMDTMDQMVGMVMAILTLIAAISLLVGGIGIMNIMLVSVSERTREIGIRKSLGAKGKHIRSQFIIEAGTTSAIGDIIGILFGILMANGITAVIDAFVAQGSGYSAVPTLGGVLVSFGVSVAIGVVFGYLPANKAARLNPIDALRYE